MVATALATAIHTFEYSALLVDSPQLLGKAVGRRCRTGKSSIDRPDQERCRIGTAKDPSFIAESLVESGSSRWSQSEITGISFVVRAAFVHGVFSQEILFRF